MECKPVRLQKYLASCGIASRRKAEELILSGCVTVNGEIVTQMGTAVLPGIDVVCVDGKPAEPESQLVYVALNKPKGYVSTAQDQFGRPAVVDLVKELPERIYPVGRLDYDTSGLILLTNDGDFAYKLTHPKHHLSKIYIARIKGIITEDERSVFESGLQIEGYTTAPAVMEILKTDAAAGTTKVRVILYEGRNRQIRRMVEALGHEVLELRRVAIGGVELGNLEEGKWRHLLPEEILKLSGQ